MLWAQKWDYKRHEYRPYKIPDDWFCVLNHPDLNAIVNCASWRQTASLRGRLHEQKHSQCGRVRLRRLRRVHDQRDCG